jgi:3-methyladenine DNA glycosylase AlkD
VSAPHPTLAAAVRQGLAAAANPAAAPAMQAYMKSALPFLGVAAPERRRVVAAAFAAATAAHPLADIGSLVATLMPLWHQAGHREVRYAALDLLRLAPLRRLIDLPLLPALMEMITDGAWWDFNDEISGNALMVLLQRQPAAMQPELRRWACSDNLWLRRAAMLCQRGIKQGFDAALLYDCIRPSLGNDPLAREFFIRKGMGWALRERSYAAPDEVMAFCAEHHDRLSPLTRREALRAIERRRAQAA